MRNAYNEVTAIWKKMESEKTLWSTQIAFFEPFLQMINPSVALNDDQVSVLELQIRSVIKNPTMTVAREIAIWVNTLR